MNILYSVLASGWGGLEKYPLTIYDGIVSNGNNVFLLTIENSILHKECIKRNIRVFTIKKYRKFSFEIVKTMTRIVEENNIDVVHSNKTGEIYNWYFALRNFKKAKYVVTSHMGIIKRVKFISHIFYKRVDKMIVISKGEYEKANKYIPIDRKKIVLLHHGIDFRNNANEKELNIRQMYDIPKEAIVILSIGNLTKAKGIYDLLEAANEILEKYSDIFFIWVGDSKNVKDKNCMEECIKITKTSGIDKRFYFIGYRNNIHPIMVESNIFVLPSHYETFGFVYIEAMFSELPIIGTNTGILPEIINNTIGEMVDIGNEKEIAAAIERIYFNLKKDKKYYKANKEIAINNFNIDKHIEKLLEIYSE